MIEAYNFLKDTKTYYLSTISNNKPDTRPFGTINIFDNKLYIQTGRNKDVYKQIIDNNNVSICAFNGHEWIRINGELIEDNRVEAKKSMLDNYEELRSMYDENDDNTVVFYFKKANITINSFTDKQKRFEI